MGEGAKPLTNGGRGFGRQGLRAEAAAQHELLEATKAQSDAQVDGFTVQAVWPASRACRLRAARALAHEACSTAVGDEQPAQHALRA